MMFAKSLASAAVVVAFLAAPAANAACVYNNSSVWLELHWTSSTLGAVAIANAGPGPGTEGCGRMNHDIGTLEVKGNNQFFCPLPFSTNNTTVTVIDDPSKPHKLHCKRDVGKGWMGD